MRIIFNREKEPAQKYLRKGECIGNRRNRTFILYHTTDDETNTHKYNESEKGEQQHFKESIHTIYQRKVENKVAKRHHDDKTDYMEKKPAEHFTENKMCPIDRCGCYSL